MLQRLTLNGFKSINAIDIELHLLNILIGANGAGKSNLISFFKMLNEIIVNALWVYEKAKSIFGPQLAEKLGYP